jgi:16S rRNA processing protein RimM
MAPALGPERRARPRPDNTERQVGPRPDKLIDRDRLVCIGRVKEAFGLQGEIKVLPLTDAPEHYRELKSAVLDTAKGLRAFDIETLREAGGNWVLKLTGLTGRDAAEALKGAELLVDEAAIAPLAENEYFTEDLVGCAVETVSGATVGSVTGVLEAGARHLLQVKGAGGEVLVPLVETIVKEVRLATRTIRIDPPPGLLELNSR